MRKLIVTFLVVALAIVALAIAGEASARPAPPMVSVAQVPASWLTAFKRGYGRKLSCVAATRMRICYDGAYEAWVFLFRPTRCILEGRMTPDTGNVKRDYNSINRNPTVRKRQKVC